ncbi:tyrosine-type recombinase/integrase [Halalkalibacter hemicellulosilyticus]|uniref:Site-specific recombinase n=1 Tax=Halalkalibacter hemicellulosilyticusJCM 9152 TaxID=1236971 RepID=W4QHN6_9BACI|nr:site-specific integrase [Halalkalibacter hemicellulosilyticus]GAE30844.1 site-specific recombinase [Halalkalibacter hemicellulosilyticusJCM 9152]
MKNQLPPFVEAFLQELSFKGRKPSTISRYRYDLLDFQAWIDDNYNGKWDLSKNEIDIFFFDLQIKRNYHTRTIRRIHSVLKQLALFQQNQRQPKLRAILLIDPPELTVEPLSSSDWISLEEEQQLFQSLRSTAFLSEKQLETFRYYQARNEFIITLFLRYGLTIQEVTNINMSHIQFQHRRIQIADVHHTVRTLMLTNDDAALSYRYMKTIPEPVRPKFHSHDPFFVAFDFQRKTFHWSYEDDAPKRMTIIAIQKMLRQEIERAQLRKGISAQTLRNTAILRRLVSGEKLHQLLEATGYTSEQSLQRYIQTYLTLSDVQRIQLQKSS